MRLDTFKVIRETEGDVLEGVNLSNQYCGLFRCPVVEAAPLLPELRKLFIDAIMMLVEQGHDPYEWEMDLKIHMLMANQYPCIPNWHCDNVPRFFGCTDYEEIKDDTPPMYLWLSDSPTTEFVKDCFTYEGMVNSHGELAGIIGDKPTTKAPAKTWISMNQKTPHRGSQAEANGWRVFVRLTHKSITPARPVNDYIRRHCQVYLDPNTFEW